MCSDDCMQRSQEMYNNLNAEIVRVRAELEDADNAFMKEWQRSRGLQADLATANQRLLDVAELYNTAVATIMEQAREIRQLKQTIAVASAIAKAL